MSFERLVDRDQVLASLDELDRRIGCEEADEALSNEKIVFSQDDPDRHERNDSGGSAARWWTHHLDRDVAANAINTVVSLRSDSTGGSLASVMSNWESEPVVAQVPVSVGVLCVDDQPVFRQVARELIGAIPGFTVLGEASSGEQALALVDEVQPQLVLMDVRMPGMDGVEASRRLSASHPEVVDRAGLLRPEPAAAPRPGRSRYMDLQGEVVPGASAGAVGGARVG